MDKIIKEEHFMPEYIFGKVIGAQETVLSSGRKVYEPVIVDPEELPKFNPPGFKGWFVSRDGDRMLALVCPGDRIRLEAIPDHVEQPVARKA